MHDDELYMQRAIDIASLGHGRVSPNPMVGCVIVHKGKIIGEGWHQSFGKEHAEAIALQNVKDKSLLPEATMYVTLEPCAHHGKTPPCVVRILDEKVGKVVIAVKDINPLVAGKGINYLEKAGLKTEVGCLSKEAERLNSRFFTFYNKKRPYIILKWAETEDGFIARLNNDSKWISNQYARKLVHKWRSEEDSIMVGTDTAQNDDPSLTTRDWPGENPVRIVVDRNLRLPLTLNLFNGEVQTLCYNLIKDEIMPGIEFVRLEKTGFLRSLMHDLHKRQVQSIIVEGGAITLNLLLKEGLWDEARIFKGTMKFNEGIEAPIIAQPFLDSRVSIMDNELIIYKNSI